MGLETILSGITGFTDGGANTAKQLRDVLTDMTIQLSATTSNISELINDVGYITTSGVTGLEAIDEGNGIGYRLIGKDPSQFGNIGVNAVDFGYHLTLNSGATGSAAVNFGADNNVSGQHGFAQGYSNIVSSYGGFAKGDLHVVSGQSASSFGYQNIAGGDMSASFGYLNTVRGYASFVSGYNNVANGNYSAVFGVNNNGSGSNSFVGGSFNIGSGVSSVVFGANNDASGAFSFIQGSGNTATGYGDAVYGYKNTTEGGNSQGYRFAAGIRNKIDSFTSSVIGLGHWSSSIGTTIVGQSALQTTGGANSANTPMFVVGNGQFNYNANVLSGVTRSNAFTVLYGGLVTAPSLSTALIDADITGRVLTTREWVTGYTSGLEAIDEGNGVGWRLIGRDPSQFGNIGVNAVDFGYQYSLNSGATGSAAVNFGADNNVSGMHGFAQGYNNNVSGYASTARGDDNVVVTDWSFVVGGENNVSGAYGSGTDAAFNFVSGQLNTILSGTGNNQIGNHTIFGSVNTITATATTTSSNFIVGVGNVTSGYGSFVFGYENNISSTLSNGSGVNFAFGETNRMRSYYSSVLGVGHDITGSFTTAVGVASNVLSDNASGVSTERTLFVVGNGTVDGNRNVLTRSNAFEVTYNGLVKAPSLSTAEINSETTGKILTTREWVTGYTSGFTSSGTLQTVTDAGNTTTNSMTLTGTKVTFNLDNGSGGGVFMNTGGGIEMIGGLGQSVVLSPQSIIYDSATAVRTTIDLTTSNSSVNRNMNLPDADGEFVLRVDVPATSGSTGLVGQIAYDASNFYACVATNTWVRAALASW